MTTFIIRLFSATISCLLLFTCTVIGQQLLPADQQKLLQFEQDASTYKEQGNQPMYADCLNKIGMIYWHNEIYDKALEHFFNSIEINRAIGNRHAMMQISSYVATIYFDIEQSFSQSPGKKNCALRIICSPSVYVQKYENYRL